MSELLDGFIRLLEVDFMAWYTSLPATIPIAIIAALTVAGEPERESTR